MTTNLDKQLLLKLLNGEKSENHTEGNPLAQNLGLYIQEVSKNRIIIRYDVSDAFAQGKGVIQGGILSAMLDFSAAYLGLVNVGSNQDVATTNLSINYLRAALPGQYFAEATLDKVGNKMVYASAKLYRYPEKPIANAIFSMAVV